MIQQQHQQQQQQQHVAQQHNPPPPPRSLSATTSGIITRKRSSSKTQSNYNPTSSHEQQQLSLRTNNLNSTFQQQVAPLERLVWVLKIRSLNGTFESKTLIVPEIPETLKLGRPGGSKVQSKPTNGFFDSRVLSRNHAELFIDPDKKSLFIRDLKSSNGTYINSKQIEPFRSYELKINDKFDLGSNLENQTAHKKISCEVTDLLLMDLKEYNDSVYKSDQERKIDEKEFFNNAVDALIYGDVVNDMYEDNLLSALATNSSESKNLENNFSISGLYPSSNIKNSSKLEETISQLLITINNEFLQNEKLNKVHKFLINYNDNLDQFEQFLQSKNQKANGVLQESLDEHLSIINESNSKMEQLSGKNEKLTTELVTKIETLEQTQKILRKLEDEMKTKDEELNDYRNQIDQLNHKYDELCKEKELVINFQTGEKIKAKNTNIELTTDEDEKELSTTNGHENGNGFEVEKKGSESDVDDYDSDDSNDEVDEVIIDSDTPEIPDESAVPKTLTKPKTSQILKPGLFQATVFLLAGLLVGGVTVYQRN